MKKEREVPLEEFKFHYHLGNSVGSSDKYFMAHDLDEASEMFEYACVKRHPSAPYQSGKMESLEKRLGID